METRRGIKQKMNGGFPSHAGFPGRILSGEDGRGGWTRRKPGRTALHRPGRVPGRDIRENGYDFRNSPASCGDTKRIRRFIHRKPPLSEGVGRKRKIPALFLDSPRMAQYLVCVLRSDHNIGYPAESNPLTHLEPTTWI